MTALPALLLLVCLLCLSSGPVAFAEGQPRLAVESPILTIDSDTLFEESDYGKRTFAEFEARGAELSAENRQIEEELIAEEKQLTELRPTMAATEFRVLADAFDEKVQGIRREQDRKTRELNNQLEDRRGIFLNAAIPVLEQLMREAGAAVVLERRSVFISSNAVDITRIAIERLNSALEENDIAPEQ